jgi:hypothetical protein
MVRHHRERIIKKRKKFLDGIWSGGWFGREGVEHPGRELGRLTKYAWHHHHCGMCTQKWDRASDEAKFKEAEYRDARFHVDA